MHNYLLQAALALKAHKEQLSAEQYAQQAENLETQLDALIDAKRQLTDPDNARFAKRLRKHREHVLRLLYVDGLNATNNLAERQLRPEVITRKTNGCNRTENGADTHAVLGSSWLVSWLLVASNPYLFWIIWSNFKSVASRRLH